MRSFRYLMLSLLAFLVVFTITSCDDEGSSSKTVACTTPADCKASQDCKFESLTIEKGVCVDRTTCVADSDCSDGLLCSDGEYCGTRDAFAVKPITLNDAMKDADYPTVKLEVTGSAAAYYFVVVDETKLPAGLTLSEEGNLSGKVTADLGSYTFTVKATNGPKDAAAFYNYREATADLTINVIENTANCGDNSCPDTNKGVCDDSTGSIVCSCDAGYQDNNSDGACNADCATAALACNNGACADTTGTAVCECNENWTNDTTDGFCNTCDASTFHVNLTDATLCESNVKTVTCTNTPGSDADWATGFTGGEFEQNWTGTEFVPTTPVDKCLWTCTNTDKVHDVDAGKCICGMGLTDDTQGGCKTPCFDNQIDNGDGTCSCYAGYAGDACLVCATGYKAVNGMCKIDCDKDNTEPNTAGDACVCEDGFFLVDGGDGECFNPCVGDTAPDCDGTEICQALTAANPVCVCDTMAGFVDNAGTCECDTTANRINDGNDVCVCDSSHVEDLDGLCVAEGTCAVDTLSDVTPTNDTYATAAELTLVAGAASYANLNNQDASCEKTTDWYKVTVAADKVLKVDITFLNSDGNLDLGLYGVDDTDTFKSSTSYSDNESVEYTFRAETDVYIKVYPKSDNDYKANYTMDILVKDALPITVLDGGDTCADAVTITDSGIYSGSTTEFTNDFLQEASCIDEDEKGKDVVYSVTVDAGETLKAELTATYPDNDGDNASVVLYLVDNCADMNCSASSSHWTLGSPVSLEYLNETGASQTLFLILDAWGNSDTKINIDYSLEVEFVEANEPAVCDPTCNTDEEICSDIDGVATCTCDADKGFFDNGFSCVNPCSAVTCETNSHCEASDALTTACLCDEDYRELNGECLAYEDNNGGDACASAVTITSGLYSGTTVGSANSLTGCDATATDGAGFGADNFYTFTVDHEVDFYSFLISTGDIDWNPVLRLYKAGTPDACTFADTDSLFCNDHDLLSSDGKPAEAIDYDDYWGEVYLKTLEAGTYYLIVDGNNDAVASDTPIASEGTYTLEVNFGNACNVNACNADKELCVAEGLGDDQYSCACDADKGYFEDADGACVNPCDDANNVCPVAGANGTDTCTGTSLTDYTCGCVDNYFEVIDDTDVHTCESACDLVDAPDCSAEGDNVECRASSNTDAACGCETGYFDANDTEVFVCVADLSVNTCGDASLYTITANEVLYGSTKNASSDYNPLEEGADRYTSCTNWKAPGHDVAYAVTIPDTFTLDVSLTSLGGEDTSLYLLSDCADAINTCAVGSDSGNPEDITFENTTGADITYFIVVDAYSTSTTFDFSLAVTLTPPPLCGNGDVDTADGEECDVSNTADPLNGGDCLLGGTLSCNDQCMFDKTQCWECDGSDDTTQCADIDSTKPVCYVNTHACGAAQAVCGNDSVETGEECDGTLVDASCPAGMSGVKTCVDAGEVNECSINATACEVCEDVLTTASDNSLRDNATVLTLTERTTQWDNLTTSLVSTSFCNQAKDWYKVTVPANHKISVDILFVDADGDLDLRLYAGDSTSYESSAGSSDIESVSNVDDILTANTDYFINVRYAQNTYSMIITLEQTCTLNSECNSGNGMCLNEVCYDANPCTGVTCDATNGDGICTPENATDYTCGCNADYFFDGTDTCVDPCVGSTCATDKPNSECVATALDVTVCECSVGFNELDGNCVTPQEIVGADTCTPDDSIPVIDATGIWTGLVTADNNSPGCRATTGRNDVLYKVILTEDSYLSVDGSNDDFDGYIAFRETCADDTNELVCGDFGITEDFSGFYSAGTYYLLIEEYGTEADPYSFEVIIKPNPCNTVTCDTTKPNSTCTPTSTTEFTCECNAGLFDDGTDCVDPCSGNTCDATTEVCNATAANAYDCNCADGYLDNGTSCVADLGVDTCNDVNIYTVTESEILVGSTVDFANDYTNEASCVTESSINGNDTVYAVTLANDADLFVELTTNDGGWVIVYLIDDCGAFSCSTTSSSATETSPVNFTFKNETGSDHTYFIIVDRYGTTSDMTYTLDVQITTPTPTPACTLASEGTDCTDAALTKCLVDDADDMNNVCVACLADADCIDGTNTVCNQTSNVCEAPTATTTVDWCNTQWPLTIDANDTEVFGQVYVDGVTNVTTDTGDASISAELCYFADGQTAADAVCITATFNKSVDGNDNDEYKATLTGLADGTYNYYFQFKTSDDTAFLLCDLNDTRNGTAYNSGETYNGDTGVAVIATAQPTGGVFISEYVEGSASNKALEIYNGTGVDIDLADYQLWKITNGGTWNEGILDLSGTLLAGDVYVICGNQSEQNLQDLSDLIDSFIAFSGDDAIGLAKNDGSGTFILIDAVGTEGVDPGSSWPVAGTGSTVSHTLIRKSSILVGNTDWASSAGTDATSSEWEVLDIDVFTGLGSR